MLSRRLRWRGAPLGINDGVWGHEHFHAHFDRLSNPFLPEVAGATQADANQAYECPESWFQYELLLLRGWNEGLADVYGALKSGNPRFMFGSIDGPQSRDLSGPILTITNQTDIHAAMDFNAKRFSAATPCKTFFVYDLATEISRPLWKIAQNKDFLSFNRTAALTQTTRQRLATFSIACKVLEKTYRAKIGRRSKQIM